MEVSELRNEMVALFKEVQANFKQIATQFEQVNQRFERVDERFERVDERFERVDERFERVEKRLEDMTARMTAEHEETRRHFAVVAKRMKAERNLVLDQSLGNAERIEDHERRITALERRK